MTLPPSTFVGLTRLAEDLLSAGWEGDLHLVLPALLFDNLLKDEEALRRYLDLPVRREVLTLRFTFHGKIHLEIHRIEAEAEVFLV